jgi:hypothetical protein
MTKHFGFVIEIHRWKLLTNTVMIDRITAIKPVTAGIAEIRSFRFSSVIVKVNVGYTYLKDKKS